MTEACVAITRGGVTYQITKPARRGPSHAVLSRLRNTLDLTDQDDLRAGAILAVLCAGLRKNELVTLDVRDVSEVDGVLCLYVRRSRGPSRSQERMVPLGADGASLLRRYCIRERLAQQAPDAPLFWTLGRHGRCRRTRITGHAVNYWLEQLRRRGGLERRLTSRSLRQTLVA
jgi:site-specific recombinase XerD